MWKKTIVLSFLLSFSQIAFGQDQPDSQSHRAPITQALHEFLAARNEGNIDMQVKYLYPEFPGISRDSTIYLMKWYLQQQQQSDSSYYMTSRSIDSVVFISDVIENDGKRYALVKYSQRVTQDYSSLKNEGGLSFAIRALLVKLKKEFGEENLNWNKETLLMEIRYQEKQYCVLDSVDNQWKFIVDPSGVEAIFKDLE